MSYVNNVTGNVEVTNAIGSIESITTTGNVTTVTAKAQVKVINVVGKLGIAQIVEKDYEKLENQPSINGIKLVGNKTTEDLGIVGTSMTEIELSTDITNPTEILNYIGASGTYVAKNAGVLGTGGEPMVVLAKGQFFSIHNLKDYANALGLGDEVSDSDNVIDVEARLFEGEKVTVRIFGNGNVEQLVWLNSENVNDYVDSFNPADFIYALYGIRIYNNKIATNPATQTDIDNGYDNFKPVTSNTIAYAIQRKGANYFPTKDEFHYLHSEVETLGTDLTTLKTEIETILESVVTVDE